MKARGRDCARRPRVAMDCFRWAVRWACQAFFSQASVCNARSTCRIGSSPVVAAVRSVLLHDCSMSGTEAPPSSPGQPMLSATTHTNVNASQATATHAAPLSYRRRHRRVIRRPYRAIVVSPIAGSASSMNEVSGPRHPSGARGLVSRQLSNASESVAAVVPRLSHDASSPW